MRKVRVPLRPRHFVGVKGSEKMTEKTRGQILQELFFYKQPINIILELKKKKESTNMAHIAKKADCTYAHCVTILKIFEKEGLVVFDKSGRSVYITLTDVGELVVDDVVKVFEKIGRIK